MLRHSDTSTLIDKANKFCILSKNLTMELDFGNFEIQTNTCCSKWILLETNKKQKKRVPQVIQYSVGLNPYHNDNHNEISFHICT